MTVNVEAAILNPKKTTKIALVGNPNAGKTALFNALTGLRSKTANYPGITVDVRKGTLRIQEHDIELIDLPGIYNLDGLTPEEKVATETLKGEFLNESADLILLVLDATNLERNLFLASEVMDLERPTVVALNMIDAAESAGIAIDLEQLAVQLNCPVIPVSARTGSGLDQLRSTLRRFLVDPDEPDSVESKSHVSCVSGCTGCSFAARYDWAEGVAGKTVRTPDSYGRTTAKIDRILTHPTIGIIAFTFVMLIVFYLIFSLASIPMTLIEDGFSWVASVVDRLIPTLTVHWLGWSVAVFGLSMACFWLGYAATNAKWTAFKTTLAGAVSVLISILPISDFRSLLIDGVIGGVGGVLVFLPQICILFFFIALLEDSGYLARAAFVMERVMRRVGLPGKAFVPMLSAHACAIPGIMATRVIENWRDRLVTILVLPLLTCSARLPVYAVVTTLLFSDSPAMAALVFLGAYLLGIFAALFSAFCLKLTILHGETAPMVLELPPYRMPSLRNAAITVIDRAVVFVKRAGTIILLISLILWFMATYPKIPKEQMPSVVAQQIESRQEQTAISDGENPDLLSGRADDLMAQDQLAYSWAGRVGRLVEPIFRPLGFDWKMNVGVVSSFAAREVIVSTLAIIYGVGEKGAEDEATLTETLRRQRRADGTPVYTRATCFSLLVFYVLAMQCLPTQVVTKRETGSWKWAIFQLVYMTLMAYSAALLTYQIASRIAT